jgi:dTDP-4-dehydrorhamnose reductase
MNILITGANNYIAHDLINFFSDKKSNKIIATYKKKIKKIKKKNQQKHMRKIKKIKKNHLKIKKNQKKSKKNQKNHRFKP